MDLDDNDFKRIDKAIASTKNGLAGLIVEETTAKEWVDNPAFAHCQAEVAAHLAEIRVRVEAARNALVELQAELVKARADHSLDRSRKRVTDIVSALPSLKKWLKRLKPKE